MTRKKNRRLRYNCDAVTGVRVWSKDGILWVPSDSDTTIWLDAQKTGTSTEIAGNTWIDKSATPVTFSGTGTYSATGLNGKPCISFNGTSDGFTSAGTVCATPFTLFVVSTAGGGTSNKRSVSSVQATRLFFGAQSNNHTTFFGNGTAWNDTAANTPSKSVVSPSIVAVVNAGATATPYHNGTAQNTKVGTMATATGMMVGSAVGVQFWDGTIGEVILFPTALSASDRQKVEGYLGWRWDLVSLLPSGHPYKDYQPYV